VLFYAGGLIWQRGRYIDLGTLGGTDTTGTGINDAGVVVGTSSRADGTEHAFRWYRGRMTDLGTLGGPDSAAAAVSGNGDIAGRSALPDGTEHVFFWRHGRMIDTGVAAGPFDVHLNDRGQIAGEVPGGDTLNFRAYVWQRGVTTDLGSLGGASVQVFGINDRGEIVGRATTAAGDWHAFRWYRGRMTDLGTLGGAESTAVDINERGQIAGFSNPAEGPAHAFRWADGVMTDLSATEEPGVLTYASAINERGDVVGDRQAADGYGYTGVVWRGRRLLILDPLGGSGQAGGINDAGLAVGLISLDPFAPTRAAVWDTAGR
jgi:probable HAF family extracellular repeat protein